MSLENQFKVALETLPHMKTEYPEIELRLGKFDDKSKSFKSSLNKDVFMKILNLFQNGKCWESYNVVQNKDYFRSNLRLTKDGDNIICIQKIKLGASDIKYDKLDVRLSISTETPCEIPNDIDLNKSLDGQNFDTIRTKERHTFNYKNIWQYDFTIVNDEIFEIEIELIKPKDVIKKYTISYLAESITMKVNDIMRMI